MLLFIFNSRLYAQVIYTDITDAIPNATYPLDLNNDGITDFLIQFDAGNKPMCKPQNNNAYSGELVGGLHLPWALSSSINICDTLLTWYDSSNPGILAWQTSTGHWVGATDKYLALKLLARTNTYYGWARLDMLASSASFTIKDYAYESSPNTCILTGQKKPGNNENAPRHNFSVFPNPLISTTTIRATNNFTNATFAISNVYGQTVKQVHNISGQSVTLTRGNLASGLYFIRLIEKNEIIAQQKLIVTN